ncbi:hypothetical protein QAD02_018721 [Eretmocerus hayati]|uniref:Uncharacterized protein n=1 Tax=Eretmocerus hayati TaxID=131215 RepID=A0ACC2PH60_9HYME|nr:hypothetical protein QAD02_018721 [Eretmocerus hayati]
MEQSRVEDEESRNFWAAIERGMGKTIPTYVKNILKLQRIDHQNTMKKYDATIIDKLEVIVQSDGFREMIPPGVNLIDYYGVCYKKPSKFQFLLGDRTDLESIINLCKEKGNAFWVKTKSDRGIKRSIEELEKSILDYHYNGVENNESRKCSTLLRMILMHLDRNSDSDKYQNRYTEPYKKFWVYIFLLAGVVAYETLEENLPIPSKQTIYRYIGKANPRNRAILDIVGLKNHLANGNYPLEVWVSDDATKITEKAEIDPATGELVGFVPPLDKNSFPIQGAFKVTSPEDLLNYKENNKLAKYLHVFMVQPLAENAPPFCLAMMPSDSSNTAEDCVKRHIFIKDELKKENIIVKGFSADGDPRALSAMKIMTKLGKKPSNNKYRIEWFHASFETEENYVSDVVHVVNRFKTRLLKESITLPLGPHIVSSSHLLYMCENESIDKHLLSASDLANDDKMRFASSIKMCHRRVYEALRNVPGSEGTQAYIKVMNFIAHSYLSAELNPLRRIYCITYALFFCRLWRKSLSQNSQLSVQHNFISLNTYTCLELNAHAMVRIVFDLLENPDSQRNFIPHLMSSQPCEGFFRILRSLHTVFCTVVNCTYLGACHKVHRIKMIGDLMSCDYTKYNERLNFPRNRILMASCEKIRKEQLCVDLGNEEMFDASLSVEALHNVMARAKVDAFNEIRILGVQSIQFEDCDHISVTPSDLKRMANTEDPEPDIDQLVDSTGNLEGDDGTGGINDGGPARNDDFVALPGFDDYMLHRERSAMIPDTSTHQDPRFIQTTDENGQVSIVRSSRLWYIINKGNDAKKLSSDRRIRVQEGNRRSIGPRKPPIAIFGIQDEIYLLDWCLFRVEESDKCLIGLICGFAYMYEAQWVAITYSKNSVKVVHENETSDGSHKVLGVLGSWFNVDSTRILRKETRLLNQGLVELERYEYTLPKLTCHNGSVVVPQDLYDRIKDMMLP